MKIHFPTSFATDKRLGRAYNEEFEKIDDDDWVCLRDHDTLFLLPETINHIYGYAERFPDYVLTCYANRNHSSLPMQILGGKISDNGDMYYHAELARAQASRLYSATEIRMNISGMLMLVSKRMWKQVKFADGLKCLGVDFNFCRELRNNKKRIFRMDGVYIWHTYRLGDVNNKNHLI